MGDRLPKLRLGCRFALAAVVAALASCGGDDACAPREPSPIDPATVGRVEGVVRLDGVAPEPQELTVSKAAGCTHGQATPVLDESLVVTDGLIQGVVIYVKGYLEGLTFAVPTEPVLLDQHGCVYTPHVAAARVCQPIQLLNSDKVLHNVRSVSTENKEFNFALSSAGHTRTRRFTKPEVAVMLRCDVHSWMRSWIAVFDHPFFAVSAADGSFSIAGLPAGSYEIEAWHERLGTSSTTAVVTAHSTTRADLAFAAPSGSNPSGSNPSGSNPSGSN